MQRQFNPSFIILDFALGLHSICMLHLYVLELNEEFTRIQHITAAKCK